MPTFVVVAEARADAEIACDLADRVCSENGPDWLRDFAGWHGEVHRLDDLRTWRGIESETPYTTWIDVKQLRLKTFRKKRGIRVHGPRVSGAHDLVAGRSALALVNRHVPDADAVLLIRDTDGDNKRIVGLKQAREEVEPTASFLVVLGVEHPKREAWVLCGFSPENNNESKLLQKETQRLGFDPTTHPEGLTASGDKPDAKRNAKAVVRRLTDDRYEREKSCWRETPLQVLIEKGEASRLARYPKEVEDRLLPRLGT